MNSEIIDLKPEKKIIDLLLEKYGLIAQTEEVAEKTLKALKLLEFSDIYCYSDKGKVIGFYPKIMLKHVLGKFKIINPTGSMVDNYIYKDGIYQKTEDLKMYLYNHLRLDDRDITKNIKEALKVIAISMKIDSELLNADTNLINFKNGIYNISKKELQSHNYSFISTIQVNTNYRDYSMFKRKIQDSLWWNYLNTSFNAELIPVIQEMIGYCLSSFTEAQKMFILLGEGKNGKSVLISILNAFFSKEFIASVELKDLCRHEFAARLYNKVINTCADISSEYISNTGLLKQLIGEDMFEARPLYENPFRFKNRAKMIFSGNELPSTADKSYAFIRRLIILNCNKIITDENVITDLSAKIIKNEMELIASWAIEGLQRLIQNNFVFSTCDEIIDSLEKYKLHNNSISSFITDFCYISKSSNDFIPKIEFMNLYKRYCDSENTKPLGSKNLNQTMRENQIYEKKHTLYKGRYWQGICWTKNIYEFEKLLLGTEYDDEETYNAIEREGMKNG